MLRQLAVTLQHLPDATVLVDHNRTILRANHAMEQLFGYTAGGLNNQPLELLIPQDRREIHDKLLREFAENPSAPPKGTGLPKHGMRKDGSMFIVDITFSAIKHAGSVSFLATVRDISASKQTELELRQSNRSLRLLSTVNRLINQIHNEQELLQEVCRSAIEVGSYRMAWVGLADKGPDKKIIPVAFHGFNNGFIENLNISWCETSPYQTAAAESIRGGTQVICNNIMSNPHMTPCRTDAKQRGYQAVAALPLKNQEATWGTLALFASESSAFREKESAILSELAADLSRGIQSIRHARLTE